MLLLLIAGLAAAQGTPVACPADSANKPLEYTSVIEVINGSEGDLAPDDETKKGDNVVQLWKLAPMAGSKMILRCTYRDTKTAVTLELPKDLRVCTKNFTMSGKGPVSIACK